MGALLGNRFNTVLHHSLYGCIHIYTIELHCYAHGNIHHCGMYVSFTFEAVVPLLFEFLILYRQLFGLGYGEAVLAYP